MQQIKSLFKRSYIKSFSAVLLLIGVSIYSCKKDSFKTTSTLTDQAISALKSWYTTAYPVQKSSVPKKDLLTVNVSANGDLSKLISPDWNNVNSYLKDNVETYEAPLDSGVKLAIAKTEDLPYFNFNKNASKSSYIFQKVGNSYRAFVMLVIADTSYLKGDYTKLKTNTFKSYDDDFSGKVIYLTPKGSLVSAWFYNNGNLTGSYSPENDNRNILNMKGSQSIKSLATCTTYSIFEGGICAINTCTFTYSIITICSSSVQQPGRDPSGNGGGGGGFPNPVTTQQKTTAELKRLTLVRIFLVQLQKL